MTTGSYGFESGRDVSRYVRCDLFERDEGRIVGYAPVAAHLRGPHGGVRAGALLTLLDQVGGVCGGLAALPDGWIVSTNIAARVVAFAHAGPFRVEASLLRRGRNNVVASVRAVDEGNDDLIVADGVLTSAILVPADGPPQWTRPLALGAGPPLDEPPPFEEWLGVRIVDARTIQILLADELRNPWGILHGGVVASLVDIATAHATGGDACDVALHFLAPNRIGPVRAHVDVAGTRSDGTVCRVELTDVGAGRVTAVAAVTARV